jgi:hypothetical protein
MRRLSLALSFVLPPAPVLAQVQTGVQCLSVVVPQRAAISPGIVWNTAGLHLENGEYYTASGGNTRAEQQGAVAGGSPHHLCTREVSNA